MQRPDANPIYDRLTRGSRTPPERAARLIGAASGAAGFAIAAITVMSVDYHDVTTIIIMFGVGLWIAALLLLVAARWRRSSQPASPPTKTTR